MSGRIVWRGCTLGLYEEGIKLRLSKMDPNCIHRLPAACYWQFTSKQLLTKFYVDLRRNRNSFPVQYCVMFFINERDCVYCAVRKCVNTTQIFFPFMWPCIVTNFLIIKPNRCTNFSNLFWNEIHITSLCVQWITPDVGQRNCPKHVEFHSKINLKN
jgi:hypothetical protein